MVRGKKAEISITILVIGVFVICTLALLSFILSTISVRNAFAGVGLLEEANVEIEKGPLNEYTSEKISKEGLPLFEKNVLVFSVEYKTVNVNNALDITKSSFETEKGSSIWDKFDLVGVE